MGLHGVPDDDIDEVGASHLSKSQRQVYETAARNESANGINRSELYGSLVFKPSELGGEQVSASAVEDAEANNYD